MTPSSAPFWPVSDHRDRSVIHRDVITMTRVSSDETVDGKIKSRVEAWKRAISDHNRGKRRDRYKRPEPQIVGVRIPAPPADPRP